MEAIAFHGVFKPQELEELRKPPPEFVYGEVTSGGAQIRNSRVSWVRSRSIQQQLWAVVGVINAEFFNFDLGGIEIPQHAVYTDGAYYDWHIDKGKNVQHRKLSLSIQLSDPADYEGGELEVWTGNKPQAMPRDLGCVIAFPAWLLHRVTPVTRGTRRSLVVWAHGPAFR